MKKKYRKLSFIILVILVLIIIIQKIPKNYTEEYRVGDYRVTEQYIKSLDMYSFKIKYNNNIYTQVTKHNYVARRELIKGITEKKGKNYTCLVYTTHKFSLYPSCIKAGNPVSYTLIKDIPGKEEVLIDKTKYKNINVNTLLDKNIYIWNHTGYYYLNDKENKEVNFLKDEDYYNKYTFKSNNYLITPNLSQKYEFDTIYVINMKNGKLSKVTLDKKISYNFYYLGTHNNLIYIIDRKNKDEYEVNIKKKTVKSVKDKYDDGKVWDNEWKSIDINKLINDKYSFNTDTIYTYLLDKNKLYYTYYKGQDKVLVSNKKVDKIIDSNEDGVFYLVKNTIYYYSPKYGEVKILTYNELEFNSDNQVFIY